MYTAWHMFFLDSHGPVRYSAARFAQMGHGVSETDKGATGTGWHGITATQTSVQSAERANRQAEFADKRRWLLGS